MKVSNTVAFSILGVVLLILYVVVRRSSHKDKFTRTCETADTNCRFVRSPVDYIAQGNTQIPAFKNMIFPHYMANPMDKSHPLSMGVDLIADEAKLQNPDLLWKQYENDWQGCGNGKEYVVNDDKTRWALRDVGDEWAVRILQAEGGPEFGPVGKHPALTDLDISVRDPFDRLYGGNFLNDALGD